MGNWTGWLLNPEDHNQRITEILGFKAGSHNEARRRFFDLLVKKGIIPQDSAYRRVLGHIRIRNRKDNRYKTDPTEILVGLGSSSLEKEKEAKGEVSS